MGGWGDTHFPPFHRAQVPAEHVPGDALCRVHPNLQLCPPAQNTSKSFLPDWGSRPCLTNEKGLGAKVRPLAAWLQRPQRLAHVTQPSPATAGLSAVWPRARGTCPQPHRSHPSAVGTDAHVAALIPLLRAKRSGQHLPLPKQHHVPQPPPPRPSVWLPPHGSPLPRQSGPYLPGAHSSQLVPMNSWLQLHLPEPRILSSQVPRLPHGASSPPGHAANGAP